MECTDLPMAALLIQDLMFLTEDIRIRHTEDTVDLILGQASINLIRVVHPKLRSRLHRHSLQNRRWHQRPLQATNIRYESVSESQCNMV